MNATKRIKAEGVLSESNKNNSTESKPSTDKSRREFLRKSAYAAYATPVITALLVNKASAASVWSATGHESNIPPSPPPPPQN